MQLIDNMQLSDSMHDAIHLFHYNHFLTFAKYFKSVRGWSLYIAHHKSELFV